MIGSFLGSFVIFGPIVTLFLGACYLSVAPLFLSDENSIRTDSFFVAIAFGVLLAGLLYVLAKIAQLPGELVVPIAFITLSAVNAVRRKGALMPNFALSSYPESIVFFLLFLVFCGSVLVGSLMMGIGEYPHVFFNGDTPLRLTHAYEIAQMSDYPPEALTTKDIYRPYHYGGPASVAVLAAITGLALHKAMFLVVLPVLLIGSFSAVCWLSRVFLKRAGSQYAAILLVIPFVKFGDEIYSRFVLDTIQLGVGRNSVRLLDEIRWLNDFNPEQFSRGIWDISATAGVFLLIVSCIFMVRAQ
ncbi:uncharacterized protein METZ01_LOCUS345780, partial [marine metagenome]